MGSEISVREIPVRYISIPSNRKRSFSLNKDSDLQVFLDSVVKEGFLHPIIVRPKGDEFELVAGRKRLWAAKHLERETIRAEVREIADNQVLAVARVENYCRSNMSPAERALELKHVLSEWERIYGPDPGKATGHQTRTSNGIANASGTGNFTKSKPQNSTFEEVGAPSSAKLALDGDRKEIEPEEQSYAVRLQQESGLPRRNTYRNLKIARSFTEEQLQSLILCEVSQDELERIANLGDPDRINDVVGLLALNKTVDEAIEKTEPKPNAQISTKLPTEDEVPNDEWLKTFCGPLRDKIQDPAAFDRDAIFYRRHRGTRNAFLREAKEDMLKSREKGYSPFVWITLKATFPEHPKYWELCSYCEGYNLNVPNCEGCSGCGYKIRMQHLPVKKK